MADEHKEDILEAVRYQKQSKIELKKRKSYLQLLVDIRLENPRDFYHIKLFSDPSAFENFTGLYTLDFSSNRLDVPCQSFYKSDCSRQKFIPN